MLKGQAKKDYQREYMRKKRATLLDPVRPAVRPVISGLIMDGNRIVGLANKPTPTAILTWCDWCQTSHEPNSHVRPLPEVDADGHIIPDFA